MLPSCIYYIAYLSTNWVQFLLRDPLLPIGPFLILPIELFPQPVGRCLLGLSSKCLGAGSVSSHPPSAHLLLEITWAHALSLSPTESLYSMYGVIHHNLFHR